MTSHHGGRHARAEALKILTILVFQHLQHDHALTTMYSETLNIQRRSIQFLQTVRLSKASVMHNHLSTYSPSRDNHLDPLVMYNFRLLFVHMIAHSRPFAR